MSEPICDKTAYESYQEAISAIIAITKREKKCKMKAYKCTFCLRFHITTINKNAGRFKKFESSTAYKGKNVPPLRPMPKIIPHPIEVYSTQKCITQEQANALKKLLDNE